MWVMEDIVNEFQSAADDVFKWLRGEYMSIQSGKMTPAVLGDVKVDAYGTKTALSHCASITADGQKTLTVTPYDTSLLPVVESALP